MVGCVFVGDEEELLQHEQDDVHLHLKLLTQHLNVIRIQGLRGQEYDAIQHASERLATLNIEHQSLVEKLCRNQLDENDEHSAQECRAMTELLQAAYPDVDIEGILSMVNQRNHEITRLESKRDQLLIDVEEMKASLETQSEEEQEENNVFQIPNVFQQRKLMQYDIEGEPYRTFTDRRTPFEEMMKYRSINEMTSEEREECAKLIDERSRKILLLKSIKQLQANQRKLDHEKEELMRRNPMEAELIRKRDRLLEVHRQEEEYRRKKFEM